ncbi:hypothetical protein BDZ94DRAFT_1309855 [Collybia nuda]|uniref:Uncharacterized protein n=1 Tax=Collybia nuda TaxID=64659 RepID=A0A9P5Y4P5_9AGAR|nr:hypothetical protein BDZ94DRAFT_1309855 [Collybia nuda]
MTESSEPAPPQLPNPFTPMAFLPSDLDYQQTMSTYVLIGTLGVGDASIWAQTTDS